MQNGVKKPSARIVSSGGDVTCVYTDDDKRRGPSSSLLILPLPVPQHSRKRSASPAIIRSIHGISEHSPLTNLQCCANLIKGTLGTAILAMPAGARDAGILFGPVGIFIVGLIIVHSMHMLVETTQFLRRHYKIASGQDEDDTAEELDFVETLNVMLRYSPPKFRKHCYWLPSYLRFCLITSQLGFLSVYLNFIAENTKYMVDFYDLPNRPPLIVYQVIVLLLLIPMAFIKSLKQMSFFSGFANLLGCISVLLAMVYFVNNLQPVSSYPLVKPIDTLAMFFGVAVFAFESINILLPCENKMLNKSALRGYDGVLNLAMIPSVCLFAAVGFYGYLCFGEELKGSFTYSIPMEPWYYMLVKPMYTISIFISFGLQFFALHSFIMELVEKINIQRIKPKLLDVLIRLLSMVIVFILGSLVPHIDLMISLIGAFSGSSLTLILPCVAHSVIVWQHYQDENPYLRDEPMTQNFMVLLLVKNASIFIFGIFGTIVGTYTSLYSIIQVLGVDELN